MFSDNLDTSASTTESHLVIQLVTVYAVERSLILLSINELSGLMSAFGDVESDRQVVQRECLV